MQQDYKNFSESADDISLEMRDVRTNLRAVTALLEKYPNEHQDEEEELIYLAMRSCYQAGINRDECLDICESFNKSFGDESALSDAYTDNAHVGNHDLYYRTKFFRKLLTKENIDLDECRKALFMNGYLLYFNVETCHFEKAKIDNALAVIAKQLGISPGNIKTTLSDAWQLQRKRSKQLKFLREQNNKVMGAA